MRTEAQRLLNAVPRPDIYDEVVIQSNGAPIALSIWTGGSGAPCVVFLPATMTHPLFYADLLDGLAQAGLNVVGVHFEGHGKSPRVGCPHSFRDLLRNTADAVNYAVGRFDPLGPAGVEPRRVGVLTHNAIDPAYRTWSGSRPPGAGSDRTIAG